MLFTLLFVAVAIATSRRPSFGIAAAIVVQPFAAEHYVFGTTVTLAKVVLLGTLAGLVGQAGWKEALRSRPARPIFIALCVVACVTAATVAVATYRTPAVRETLKWIEYALLFAVVCCAYRRDQNDALLVRCTAGIMLLVSLLALAQEAIGAPSGLRIAGSVVPRIAGPLEGPNQLASYLEIAIVTLCAWYRRRDALLATSIVVATCALVLTFSRGGIASAAIGVAAVFAARAGARKVLAIPVGAGVVLGALCAAAWDAVARVGGVLPAPPSASYAGGVGYRPELWHAAIVFWKHHPLLGIGAGNYELELGRVGMSGVRTHANSWYLQSLAEGGIALFLATVGLACTLLLRLGKKLSEAAPWRVAAFAASLALILHQVVDYLVFYPKVGGPWWILVALGATAVSGSRDVD